MVKSIRNPTRADAHTVVKHLSAPPGAGTATPQAKAPQRMRLVNVLRARLRKFMALVAQVLVGQSPDTVHDVRVWSRRLQQTLTALFPEARSRKLRSMRRTLRRARRALGEWRNCDVVLQCLARRERQTRSAEKRRAWALVIDDVRDSRKREIRRARKRLVRLGLFDLGEEIEGLVKTPAASSHEVNSLPPSEIVAAARTQWQIALSHALDNRMIEHIHAFRIQTKRLRYRIELLRDLGADDTGAPLEWLRSLQDLLGGWHDRLELGRRISEALARAQTLERQPRLAIALLKELEKERKLADSELEHLLHEASDSPRRARLDAWMAARCESPQPVADASTPTPPAVDANGARQNDA